MTQTNPTKIAVPLTQGRFSTHYGRTTDFALFDVDLPNAKVVGHTIVPVPGAHACGMAGWLKEQGVATVIVGGIGGGAVAKLQEAQIHVVAATAATELTELVQACLQQKLPAATATCSHTHGQGHQHHHGHGHGQGSPCHCRATGK